MISDYSYNDVRDLLKAIAISNVQIDAVQKNRFYSSLTEAMTKQSNWSEKVFIIQYISPMVVGRDGNTWNNWKVSLLIYKKHVAQDYTASDNCIDWAMSNSIDICSWLMKKRMDPDAYTNVFDFDETTFSAREIRMEHEAYSGAEVTFIIQPPTITLFDSAKWQ